MQTATGRSSKRIGCRIKKSKSETGENESAFHLRPSRRLHYPLQYFHHGPQMTSTNANKAFPEFNTPATIRACRPWGVIRWQIRLAGILILLLVLNFFAQTGFPTFWHQFKSSAIAVYHLMV